MARKRTWILLAGVPLLAGLLSWTWWTRSGLPTRSGTAEVPGLSGSVTVRFDLQAVPHVTADNLLDLSAALGWLHANDRMTQLELGRRSASGRLSEVFGELTVGIDSRARHLRLRETAQRLYEASGEESRAVLEAYARGVNAWLDQQGDNLPPELVLLGLEPEPWTPTDSLCFHMLMARDLSLYRNEEQRRFRWLVGLGLDLTRRLTSLQSLEPQAEIALIARELARLGARGDSPVGLRPEDGSGDGLGEAAQGSRGSNHWVLGASRTRSGRPIVAGDPHLGLGLPSIWYQATLRAPDYAATGMTLPGLPMIVIGQSQDLAWAFTNTELDVSDIFFEELNEAEDAVRRGDRWEPIRVEQQVLATPDGDRTIEVRSTDIGPFTPATGTFPAHSLAWTGHETFDPVATFIELVRATTLAEVDAAVSEFVCPVQNIALALSSGELYFTLLGSAPERGRGEGRLPLPGWDPAYQWQGLATHASKPRIVAPEQDLLHSANNDITPPGFEGSFIADPDTWHRNERIFEAIANRKQQVGPLTPLDCLSLQQDSVSLYALQLTALLKRPLRDESPRAREARSLLAGWNGDMDAGAAPALFAVFESRLAPALFGEVLRGLPQMSGPDRRRALVQFFSVAAHSQRPRSSPAPVAPTEEELANPALRELLQLAAEMELVTAGSEPRIGGGAGAPAYPEIATLLAEAWEECEELFGSDTDVWDYTELHTWQARHAMGSVPVLGRTFNRGPFPLAGSSTTIAAFSGPVSSPWREQVTHGPSMRFIADVGNPDGSLAVLPGGQSGHPFDQHYDDQLEPFLDGLAFPVLWSEEAIGAGTITTLTLAP